MSQAFLFLSLFFSVSGSIPDPKKEEPLKLELGKSIEGIYLCRGLDNESKKEYAGVVFVLRKGDGYLVKWNIVGFKEIVGIGMVHGKSLVVGYGYDTEKTAPETERAFMVMLRAGAFAPIPPSLQGKNIFFE